MIGGRRNSLLTINKASDSYIKHPYRIIFVENNNSPIHFAFYNNLSRICSEKINFSLADL